MDELDIEDEDYAEDGIEPSYTAGEIAGEEPAGAPELSSPKGKAASGGREQQQDPGSGAGEGSKR